MIVADTSAWIELLRGTGSAQHEALRSLLVQGTVGVPDVVRLEILAGAGDDQHAIRLARMLERGRPIPATPGDHDVAAQLLRLARRSGHTPRSLIDCLIAAVCLRLAVPVLARDRDYEVLSRVCDLQLYAQH